MPDLVAIPMPEPGVNPVMTDEGTHYGVARFAFANVEQEDGSQRATLHQLFMPCDGALNAPEWRVVPMF